MDRVKIEIEFKLGEIDYLKAIELLQEQGYNAKTAEFLVNEWEDQKEKK